MDKKYMVDNMIISWQDKETDKKLRLRIKRQLDRAEYEIEFWQKERDYCKELLGIKTTTTFFGIKKEKVK
jgi:ABC-type lipoprotein release transport system permease subunit